MHRKRKGVFEVSYTHQPGGGIEEKQFSDKVDYQCPVNSQNAKAISRQIRWPGYLQSNPGIKMIVL